MIRSKSNENLPSSQSQMDIQMMSHTLAIKEVSNLIFITLLCAACKSGELLFCKLAFSYFY